MTTLTFPTVAQQCATLYESGRAPGIAAAAKRFPHDKEVSWDKTTYTFEDDTSIEVSGRGPSYKYEVLLP